MLENNYENFLRDELKEHKIMKLDYKKRKRIINAALEEFTLGYAQASTDQIVQNANISKGLLFHYFGTKKKLFFFLYSYALDIIGGEFNLTDSTSSDYIKNLWDLSLKSRQLIKKYDRIYSFLAASHLILLNEFPNNEIGEDNPVETLKKKYKSRADKNLFKDFVDANHALNIIEWTVDGYSKELSKKYSNIDDMQHLSHKDKEFIEIENDLKSYFELLRQVFYKKEEVKWHG